VPIVFATGAYITETLLTLHLQGKLLKKLKVNHSVAVRLWTVDKLSLRLGYLPVNFVLIVKPDVVRFKKSINLKFHRQFIALDTA